MNWLVGQRFDLEDGRPAIVVAVKDRADHGLYIRGDDGRAAVAVDWESVERTPDGGPRSLGRMIR